MNEKISTEQSPKSRALLFARHLVLVAIVGCVNPYWIVSPESGVTKAFEVLVGAVFFSAAFAGLALLFFTRGVGKDWIGNFVRLLWVFAALILIGSWT